MRQYSATISLLLGLTTLLGSPFQKEASCDDAWMGQSREQLIENLLESNLRTYWKLENQETMTFNDSASESSDTLTFYLEDNKVYRWTPDDREEMAKQYLSEFASGNLIHNYPKVRAALLSTLQRLPQDIFLTITERQRPILFIDYYTGGIAQYAGSLEFTMREDDPPTFENGFYIIRLGDGLNDATTPEAISGIVAHEIAHRTLEHLKNKEKHSCELEIEANQLIKEWGFEEEYAKASEEFGSKKEGDSPCQEWLKKQEEKISSEEESSS